MLPLGTKAPSFNLPDVISGSMLSLDDLQSEKATVIIFSCNHCPFVVHLNHEIVALANQYIPMGVKFAVISSNDVANYPQDGPDKMAIVAKVLKFPFPYLYDESQDVAKAYDAACTPDFYVFDGKMKLSYRGRLDGSRPGTAIPLTGEDLRNAIDMTLEGKAIKEQIPSAGCGIKWK